MNTALHTTDQLAVARVDAAARQRRAAEYRTVRQQHPKPRRVSGSTVVGLAVAAALGLSILPATAVGTTDTYTGGGKQIPGLVDGWFDPTDQPAPITYPAGRVR